MTATGADTFVMHVADPVLVARIAATDVCGEPRCGGYGGWWPAAGPYEQCDTCGTLGAVPAAGRLDVLTVGIADHPELAARAGQVIDAVVVAGDGRRWAITGRALPVFDLDDEDLPPRQGYLLYSDGDDFNGIPSLWEWPIIDDPDGDYDDENYVVRDEWLTLGLDFTPGRLAVTIDTIDLLHDSDTPGTDTAAGDDPTASSAALCRSRGWEPGTRLVGYEGRGPTVIELTAIGEAEILAVVVSHAGQPQPRIEGRWSLLGRDWQPVAVD